MKAVDEGRQELKRMADLDKDTAAIVNYADGKKPELIVVGTNDRTGLKRLLLGSVARGDVTHANCPLFVTR